MENKHRRKFTDSSNLLGFLHEKVMHIIKSGEKQNILAFLASWTHECILSPITMYTVYLTQAA